MEEEMDYILFAVLHPMQYLMYNMCSINIHWIDNHHLNTKSILQTKSHSHFSDKETEVQRD